MAFYQKYEQAVVEADVADSMVIGQFDFNQLQALPWQLVCESNVGRIHAGESFVFVNLTGVSGASNKLHLADLFVNASVVHWVYTSPSFPWLKAIIRPVPDDTLKLVLDLKLESSTSINACLRDLDGVPFVSTNFSTAVPLTVGRLKTVVKVQLAGKQRSMFARLEVYLQHSDVYADGLASRSLLWHPTWQLPVGQFNQQRLRLCKKSGPEHPNMQYWLVREQS